MTERKITLKTCIVDVTYVLIPAALTVFFVFQEGGWEYRLIQLIFLLFTLHNIWGLFLDCKFLINSKRAKKAEYWTGEPIKAPDYSNMHISLYGSICIVLLTLVVLFFRNESRSVVAAALLLVTFGKRLIRCIQQKAENDSQW